jgi:hypothetical protein
MNYPLNELMVAIVSYVTEHGGYMTKTKLLKLLYLFDVEFYRVHGKTFTGFQWKYFHLGPWTKEFDPLLDELLSTGSLTEHAVERPDFDARYIRSAQPGNLRRPFDSYKDEGILKSVLDMWGPSSTGEILDYVYFRTEPMEHGIRNEKLDFSRVLPQLAETYKRQASNKSAGEIKALQREFGKRLAERVHSSAFEFTPPKYDDEFAAAMEKLDTGDL